MFVKMELVKLLMIFWTIGRSVSTDCPVGWISGVDSCYLFHRVALTWSQASHYCLSLGSHLARVESAREKDFIAEELNYLTGISWLDGIDDVNEGDWRWASNFNEKINPTFWSPGEPNTYHGIDEDCMTTAEFYHGLWNDVPCTNHHYSICEKDV